MAQKFLSDIHPTAGIKDTSGDLGTSGQVLSSTGAGTNWVNQEDGATVIYDDQFIATANQTVFTLSNTVDAENKTQVYIDGAYQAKAGYTVSGTTLTFDTGLDVSSKVEVITFATALASNAAAVIRLDEFTGNNSTTDFALAQGVTDEKVTQVYINGVYQHKDTYSITDVTLTFSTAPPTSADIEVITFDTLSSSGEIQASSTALYVKNTSGSTIDKGIPVYITGSVGNSNTLTISPANASNASHMPSTGLLLTTLANNSFGYIITNGFLKGLTTDTIDGTSTSSNDTIYVKAGGGLTITKPTGTNLIQNIGKVARSSGGNSGSILVSSILRSNDVPNIASGKIWVGDSNAVATERSLSGDATLSNTGALTLGTVPITKGGTGATSASAAKTALSLDNLDNTSDANKPVSIAGQAALDLKSNIAGPTFTGDTAAANLTLSGYLRGPASFVIDPAAHGNDTGTLVVAGNLQVDGTTTTINSTTVSIDDLNFSIATDAADSAAANGAGITIGGAGASLTYSHSGTKFVLNKPLDVTGAATFSGNINATNASSTVNIIATGINSGTNGGSSLIAGTTGVTNIAIGNKSALLGGAFDATSTVYWGNGGSLVFNNGANRLTISSNGESTISTTASNAQTALTLSTASSAASLNFSNTGTSPSNWYIQSGGGITGALRFYSNVSGSTGYRMSITSGGLVQVGDGTSQNTFLTTKSVAGWASGIKLTRGLGDGSSTGNNNFGMLVTDNGWEVSTFTSPLDNTTGRSAKLVISSTGVATFNSSGDHTIVVGTGASSHNVYVKLNAGSGGSSYINSIGSGSLILGANGAASNHLSISSGGAATFSNTLRSGNFAIGSTPYSFGTGVPTILLQGATANGRGGAITFRESDGTDISNIYSTTGADGYGTVINAAQGSFKVSVGALSATKFTITSGGNVGINETNPASKLEVNGVFGNPLTTGSAQNGIARFSQTLGNGVLDVGFGDNSGGFSWLQSRDSTNYATVYSLLLQPNGGNVGIGTTLPTTALTIRKSIPAAANSYGLQASMIEFKSYYPGYDTETVKSAIYSGVSATGTLNTQGGFLAFHVNNNGTMTERMRIDKSGAVTMGSLPSGTGYDLQTDGGNLVFVNSTRKAKKNIEPIDIGLDFILSLEPVKYDLKQNDLSQVGFIAEDMPDERLQVIQPNDNDDLSKGYSPQSVNYKQITAPLVKAIQEQQTIIEDLKSRIETLEG